MLESDGDDAVNGTMPESVADRATATTAVLVAGIARVAVEKEEEAVEVEAVVEVGTAVPWVIGMFSCRSFLASNACTRDTAAEYDPVRMRWPRGAAAAALTRVEVAWVVLVSPPGWAASIEVELAWVSAVDPVSSAGWAASIDDTGTPIAAAIGAVMGVLSSAAPSAATEVEAF